MVPVSTDSLPIERSSLSRPYSAKIVLKTFLVHENKQPESPPALRRRVCDSNEAASVARAIYKRLDADKEHFVLLALNQKHRLIGYKHVSAGTLTASLVHPREVFTAAIELRAAALMFVHNHPSGDPLPSQEDFEITRRLKSCGEILGFRILDHIILGSGEFYSFSDRGVL